MTLSPETAAARGVETKIVDLGGPVHYMETGSGPPLVLVHGLGGSHVNWLAAAPLLGRERRVLAPDLAGFGRTPPAGRSSTVEANRQLLSRFLREVVREPVVLVGNSMGGLIALMQAAEEPASLRDLVLVDPAQPRPRGAPFDWGVSARLALEALPVIGEWSVAQRARLGPEGMVKAILGLCVADLGRVPRDVFLAHVELARDRLERMPWANSAFLEALRSILAVVLRPGRYQKILSRVARRALLVHGTSDRLVPIEASRDLAHRRPDWTFKELEDTGHAPQLERAELFSDTVLSWLDA